MLVTTSLFFIFINSGGSRTKALRAMAELSEIVHLPDLQKTKHDIVYGRSRTDKKENFEKFDRLLKEANDFLDSHASEYTSDEVSKVKNKISKVKRSVDREKKIFAKSKPRECGFDQPWNENQLALLAGSLAPTAMILRILLEYCTQHCDSL